jgi:CBS-domain-containing membrane protein
MAWRQLWELLWPRDANHASHGEKWISGVGGFGGILMLLYVSHAVLENQGALMVVASMGASAVLLFAVPHGALSQPWAVFGGHLISAFIGVSCYLLLGDTMLAAAAAVGLSIGAMYYLHCIHPPGGATALVAVLGGESVTGLGYSFLVTPVLENVLLLLLMAVLLNLPFRHRRYPVALSHPRSGELQMEEKAVIAHSDLVYALSQIDSFIDVSEQDLVRIYNLAVHHTHDPIPRQLHVDECGKLDGEECICLQLLQAKG